MRTPAGEPPTELVDPFGRQITYVRLSVTDRCDLRCVYCMADNMRFLPRSQVLTLEEIARLAKCFSELGVTKLRITGGDCNRVRVTAEGRLLLCLGQEHSADLRRALRAHPLEDAAVKLAIATAMASKPRGHDFDPGARPLILRHMNTTGG